MKRSILLVAAVAASTLFTADASADHFARQRQEAAQRAASIQPDTRPRHWGGPTTTGRWYPTTTGRTVVRQNVQFVPVSPFGHFHVVRPRVWNPYFGVPYYGVPVGQHIHIQHIIND